MTGAGGVEGGADEIGGGRADRKLNGCNQAQNNGE
jgi:hypothetical protein